MEANLSKSSGADIMNTENISAFNLKSIAQMAMQKHQLGQWSEAESIYRSIYNQISPTQPEKQVTKNSLEEIYYLTILNLGDVLQKQGKFNEAIQVYQKALKLDPDFAEVYNNLGSILETEGKLEAAVTCYQQALKIKPDLSQAYNNLGNVFKKQNKLEAAIQFYQQALKITPDWAETHYNLGTALNDDGQLEAAIASYRQALKIQPDYAVAKFGICMSQLPIIYSNVDEIQLKREQYQYHLQELAKYYQSAKPKEQVDAAKVVGFVQPFYMAYQCLNDRILQKTYGEMICKLMASYYPQWSQPIPLPNLKVNEKIRVGFVSAYFRDHSNWKIPIRGWAENLDRSEFELFAYYIGTQRDQETIIAAKAFDKFTPGPLMLEQWAEAIVQDKLDILIFPEFGMDSLTVRLGCLRLAPIQITSWGHPNTSGLPTMDYYLSSDLMEPENAQDHYTEKLVKLPNLSIHYKPLEIQPLTVSKRDIGIEDDEIMFWCCQSLFKYLPQHDDIFSKIAKGLINTKFVFIQHQSEYITEVFRQRLQHTFEEFGLNYQDYCIFLRGMNIRRFAGISAIADVFLDSIGWSGCNSTLESIAHNVPVITLPGELMRGRHSLAILKMMGIQEMIASSKEEYVQLAIRLGRDAEYRQHISQLIAQNKHKLYGDLEPIRALEEFLLNAVGKPRISTINNVAEILRLAIQAHRENHLQQAEEAYRQVLSMQPNHADALSGLGMVAQQKGELTEAERWLSASAQIQPDSVKVWFTLGNLHQLQGQLPEAEAAYKKAIVLRPDAVSIYNNLGYTLQQQDKWEEAINCYQKALELQPNCVEADVNLGNALHSQDKLSPDKQADYAELNYKLGLARKNAGDLQTAEVYYRQAITLQPNFTDAHHHLGLVLEKQGKLEEAKVCYQRAL